MYVSYLQLTEEVGRGLPSLRAQERKQKKGESE